MRIDNRQLLGVTEHGTITYLITEGQEKPDRVDLEDRVNRSLCGLQILEHMVREKLDDVHLGIGRRHAVLHRIHHHSHPIREGDNTHLGRRRFGRNRTQQIHRRIL